MVTTAYTHFTCIHFPLHNLTLPGIAAKDDGVSNAHSAHQNDQATSAESSSAAYVAQKFVANAVSAVTTL